MKKILIALVFLLAACSTGETVSRNTDSISDTLIAFLPADAEKQDEQIIEQLLDIPADIVDSIEAYFSASETEKMLVIVRTKNSSAALDAQEKMNAYVASLENTAALYNPDQLAVIQNAYVISRGNTALLAICDDIEEVKKAAASLK